MRYVQNEQKRAHRELLFPVGSNLYLKWRLTFSGLLLSYLSSSYHIIKILSNYDKMNCIKAVDFFGKAKYISSMRKMVSMRYAEYPPRNQPFLGGYFIVQLYRFVWLFPEHSCPSGNFCGLYPVSLLLPPLPRRKIPMRIHGMHRCRVL